MRDWLKQAREERGISMSDISRQLGMKKAGYCLIEQGKRQKRLSMPTARMLSEILGIPIEEICKMEGL